MGDLRHVLLGAERTGQLLKISYDGGRQPGVVREVLVQKVESDRVRIICLADRVSKIYLIAKVTIVSDDANVLYQASVPRARNPRSKKMRDVDPAPAPIITIKISYFELWRAWLSRLISRTKRRR